MAFVARRSTEGKVVERQQLSGRGSNPKAMSMTDISDEDDTDTMMGYTNRTLNSPPTVRYVGEDLKNDNEDEEEEHELDDEDEEDPDTDVETSFTFGPQKTGSISSLDTNVDTIMGFCNELDECEREDQERERQLQEQIDQDLKIFGTDTDNDDDLDLETFISPQPEAVIKEEDHPIPTDTESETVWDDNRDNQSLSSFESLAVTSAPAISIDAQSAKTYFVGKTEEHNSPLLTNRTYDLGNGSVRKTDASSVSACSWTDMYGGALKQSESRSNIVPSLSLGSCSSDTSTFYKPLNEEKERQKQSTYENWVARKERQKQEKIQAAKMEREKRECEAAQRQRLSQERFEQWCKRKEEQKKKSGGSVNAKGSVSSRIGLGGTSSFANTKCSTQSLKSLKPQTSNKETPEATRQSIKEWERIKIEKQQQERERQRQQEERKQQMEKELKKGRQGAWNNWMKKVSNRPKPVPLNQGIDTLRGTVSNIYVNPIPWVSNIEPKDSRGR